MKITLGMVDSEAGGRLGGKEHLFLQGAGVRFPAPTGQFTNIYSYSSRGPIALFWLPWILQTHSAQIHTGKTYTHKIEMKTLKWYIFNGVT